ATLVLDVLSDGGYPSLDRDTIKEQYLQKALLHLEPSTLLAYRRANIKPAYFWEVYGPGPEERMLSQHLLDELFQADEEASWDLFWERYPQARGFMEVSAPGFSPDGEQALVYLGQYSSYQMGIGRFLLYQKEGVKWQEVGVAMAWMQ
ncbi:MAG: hypothetical protein AAFU64_06330, partial [Bacteroidota bacterium]